MAQNKFALLIWCTLLALSAGAGCGFRVDKTQDDNGGSVAGTSSPGTGANTGAGTTSTVGTPAPAPSGGANTAATFQEVNQQIFQPLCVSCHGSGASPDLSSYSSFVTGMTGATGTQWVVPGNASQSVIYQQVASGSMPRGGTPLTQTQLSLISDWIAAGAQND